MIIACIGVGKNINIVLLSITRLINYVRLYLILGFFSYFNELRTNCEQKKINLCVDNKLVTTISKSIPQKMKTKKGNQLNGKCVIVALGLGCGQLSVNQLQWPWANACDLNLFFYNNPINTVFSSTIQHISKRFVNERCQWLWLPLFSNSILTCNVCK